MNRKLMAVAVAGALAAPAVAFAQASSVQIYGRANLGVDSYSATGATAGSSADLKSRTRVFDSSSRLGFRGEEALGNGLKAIFLMESGVNIDNGGTTGQSGAANTSTGTLSSRTGHVGLAGNWGQLTFGRSNVWWVNGNLEQTGANHINTGINWFSGGFGRNMGVGIARLSNTIQYYSPVFSGMQAYGSYTANSEAAVAGAKTDAQVWSVSGQGTWGAFRARYDWVQSDAASPASGNRGKGVGQKAWAGFAYQPGALISIGWVQTELWNGFVGGGAYGGYVDPVAAAGGSIKLKQYGWGLNWEHTMGNWLLLGQYGEAKGIQGCATTNACNNTGAKSFTAAVRYNLSKRSSVYASYVETRNDSNYNLDYTNGSITSAASPGAGLGAASVGADPKIFAIGMQHNF